MTLCSIVKPSVPVIEYLEDLLVMARAGELQGVAVVTLNSMAGVGSGWSGSATTDVFRTIGAIEHLKLRLYGEKVQ